MESSGVDAIERQVTEPARKLADSHAQYYDFYELDRTIAAIRCHNYQRVALQFPDLMLSDSTFIYAELAKHTDAEIFILADTSYGSCCIDEIAAEHVGADLIVHYGHSCLSAPSRIPVLYVFGKPSVGMNQLAEKFRQFFDPASDRPVLILYDVAYHHCKAPPTQSLRESSPVPAEETPCCKTKPVRSEGEKGTTTQRGRSYTLLPGTSITDYSLFYIGSESPALSNIILTHNQCPAFHFDPQSGLGQELTVKSSKSLMKRYFMLQKAKDSDVVGIVAGTLGVASYMKVIQHLKSILRQAGKKYYQFVMGKINVAKMANFMEIDVFVLVACPENSLIDSKEFYRPIVTPYELELSLKSDLEWTGAYITDFNQLLHGALETTAKKPNAASDDSDEDVDRPHFSLVTGKFKYNRRYHPVQLDTLTDQARDLTIRNKATDVSTVLGSAGAEYLLQRSFQGLEQKLGETEVELATDGRRGIARGYSHEKML
ncbi:diphthamide biosynthesis protein 2-like protein [Dimargaris cristalligena]|uniref:2-(3-amino-3-carboxypropyl)histidine synthase subunit 2 n=1 Tax=Dimargaris cristalligena TaxID=215637 RepID=A0A4P9ZYI8_9FUNG|nr:diphthamide biosynthesis protein 2-like protein [Dimargaris cristalligena]|eukprot:RKP38786.1 diphthamide biosynthesis protein 2-like protein [Dimargaris cristalligena]